MNRSWTKQELELLIDKYVEEQEIHKLFPNKTKSSVYHKAHRIGLKRKVRERKYHLNQNFFKKWCPKRAYVFGWFCSDGHVSYDRTYCSIHIHKKDKLILEKIKNTMNSNHHITAYENSVNFRIYNNVICSDLIRLGCHPRKSLTLKFPRIPNEYLSHFIRGFFDGDGSIHFNKPNTIKVSFIATKNFLKNMQKQLHRKIGVRIGPLIQHYKMWICVYYGDDARKLCSWMYHNSKGLYLQRKRDRFEKHIKLRQK